MILQLVRIEPATADHDSGESCHKEIRTQLERILSSKVFARSERMKRFLEYAVEQSLQDGGTSIKEYTVAVSVYDKPSSFDPRLDPIVRVEACRLRAKLHEYYEDEGATDPIRIAIPKKGYSPIYERRGPQSVHLATDGKESRLAKRFRHESL